MTLYRYEAQARAIADELLDLLTHQEREQLASRLATASDAELWLEPTAEQLGRALDFVTEMPAKKRARWKRTPAEERPGLWGLARFAGMQSARTIALAARMEDIPGMAFRQAVRHAFLHGAPSRIAPSPDELLEEMI